MVWILCATRSINRGGDSALNLGVGAVVVGVSRVGFGFRSSCIGGGSGNGLGGGGAGVSSIRLLSDWVWPFGIM